MRSKKLLTLIVSAAMCVGLLAGCGNGKDKDAAASGTTSAAIESSTAAVTSSTASTAADAPEETTEAEGDKAAASISGDPMEKITQGYYTYCYNTEPDNSGMEMYNFFHFYEDAPVIGSVFYAGFAMNQIFYVGTYKVEKTPYDYNCYPDRKAILDAADNGTDAHVAGTAPYTIICYDWDGNEIGRMGFDGDAVYNDSEALSAVSTSDNIFLFDADGSETGYAEYYAGEVGQKYMDFVAEDPTSTLTLYHNGTYLDMVGMMIEGTWTMQESSEGYSYVLTPEDTSDTGAVFAVSTDKATAVYTPDGGEALTMTNAAAGPAVAYSFAGKFELSGMTADLTAYCYQDGTAAVIASMSGMEMPVDEGTWEMTETYSMLFHLTNAGDVESAASETGVSLSYVNEAAAAQLGVGLDVTLDFVAE